MVNVVRCSEEERGCLADRSLEEGSGLGFLAGADVKDSVDERGGLTDVSLERSGLGFIGGGVRLADVSLTRMGGLYGISGGWD